MNCQLVHLSILLRLFVSSIGIRQTFSSRRGSHFDLRTANAACYEGAFNRAVGSAVVALAATVCCVCATFTITSIVNVFQECVQAAEEARKCATAKKGLALS